MYKILDAFGLKAKANEAEMKDFGIKIFNSDTQESVYNEDDAVDWIRAHLCSYKSREPNISSTRPYSASRSAVERLSHSLNSSSVMSGYKTSENINTSDVFDIINRLETANTSDEVFRIVDEVKPDFVSGKITLEEWKEIDRMKSEQLKKFGY
jgi:hypothetical protein